MHFGHCFNVVSYYIPRRNRYVRVVSDTLLTMEYMGWGVVCHRHVSGLGTINYNSQYPWNVINCPCPWYLFLAQHFSYVVVLYAQSQSNQGILSSLNCFELLFLSKTQSVLLTMATVADVSDPGAALTGQVPRLLRIITLDLHCTVTVHWRPGVLDRMKNRTAHRWKINGSTVNILEEFNIWYDP